LTADAGSALHASSRSREPAPGGTVVLVASIACRVRPGKQAEFRSASERLMMQTRHMAGCLECRLAADPADPQSLTLIFEWFDRKAHERFVASNEYGVLKGMRFLMTAPPVVVVDEIIARERRSLSWE
jgi:quinol monooxygenase YgiN